MRTVAVLLSGLVLIAGCGHSGHPDAGVPLDESIWDSGNPCPGANTSAWVVFAEREVFSPPAGCFSGLHLYTVDATFGPPLAGVIPDFECFAEKIGNCCFTPAVGCFYSPTTGRVCQGVDAGFVLPCFPIFDGGQPDGVQCLDAGDSTPTAPPPSANAGTLTLIADGGVLGALPYDDAGYAWAQGTFFVGVSPSPFPPGSTLGIQSTGGSDFPAFSSSVPMVSPISNFAPTVCDDSAPPVVDRSVDGIFTWEPDRLGAGGDVALSLGATAIGTSTPGGTLVCRAPDAAGRMVVPAAALRRIPGFHALPVALTRRRVSTSCDPAVALESQTTRSGLIDLE